MASLPTEMRIFERVIERGSFASAAEDAGLSPSAVAKLITRLERRLGVRLINRTTRRLALTAEGEIYLERSRDILEAIEAAESEISSARVSPHGHLRVPAFPSFAVDKLAPILPDFLARYPKITIDFLLTNRFVDVIGENVDVAFRGCSTTPLWSRARLSISRESFVLARAIFPPMGGRSDLPILSGIHV
jgi:DNA-binding transcriptional LysR family regulator